MPLLSSCTPLRHKSTNTKPAETQSTDTLPTESKSISPKSTEAKSKPTSSKSTKTKPTAGHEINDQRPTLHKTIRRIIQNVKAAAQDSSTPMSKRQKAKKLHENSLVPQTRQDGERVPIRRLRSQRPPPLAARPLRIHRHPQRSPKMDQDPPSTPTSQSTDPTSHTFFTLKTGSGARRQRHRARRSAARLAASVVGDSPTETDTSLRSGVLESRMSLAEAMMGKPLEKGSPADKATSAHKDGGETFRKHNKANIETMSAEDVALTPISVQQPPVPRLFHGLDRVLFNPGVYQLQDPSSMVYNFDPYLQKIMPVTEFDYNALAEYKTSSQDPLLSRLAKEHNIKYVGSTSSMTSTLTHFHYLLSNWRPLNINMLSRGFAEKASTNFTQLNQAPNAIFLRWKNGTYAIDADKEYDNANVLMLLGKSLEKLLTMSPDDFERYRKGDPREISEAERNAPDSFHFSTQGDFLMRSQLDAHDPRLPGTGMFDLKTRAVVSVRMQSDDYEEMSGYELHKHHGSFESYEREYYDMMRSTMLKYSLQARMGRMDGIFVAYHNVKRMFGFQYLNINEMDRALHGQTDRCLGNQEFSLSIELLNKILNKATERYPSQSLRFHFETRPSQSLPFMYIFAEPVSEDDIDTIQNSQKEKVKEYERSVMGLTSETSEQEDPLNNEEASALEQKMTSDTVEIESGTVKVIDGELSKLVKSDESLAVDARGVSNNTATHLPREQAKELAVDASEVMTGTLSIISSSEPSPTASSPAPSTSSDEHSDASDQSPLITPETATMETNLKPLLAMTLTLRSRVNGAYINRPEALTPSDKWAIEYSLSEIPLPSRAWSLYESTKARRKKAFDRSNDDEDDAATAAGKDGEKVVKKRDHGWNMYIDMLRQLSAKGRELRREIDEIELDRERVVVGQPYGKPSLPGGPEASEADQDVEINGVDDYTKWLFGARRETAEE